MKTKLNNRDLWFDGKITIEPQHVIDYIEWVDHITITELDDSVKLYNKMVEKSKRLVVKNCLSPIQSTWAIPEEYATMDIVSAIKKTHFTMIEQSNWSDNDIVNRVKRVDVELKLFAKNNLFPLLKALKYIINTLKLKNEVWGTGRGSSVSSYVLYILEVHDVDSYSYDLPITDFIK